MQARLETQKAFIKQTESSIEPQKALAKQKEASLGTAELNLSYTKVIAPADGYITKKSVESGNYIQAGQPLMAVEPLDDIWVTANYKETQLAKVRVGQKVEIKVDTYTAKNSAAGLKALWPAQALFSLFPARECNRKLCQVVQRVPVKIILDKGTDPERILRIGMSVEPTIIEHGKMSKWIIALTVMLPTLIEIIDTSVVNVALDHIREAFQQE